MCKVLITGFFMFLNATIAFCGQNDICNALKSLGSKEFARILKAADEKWNSPELRAMFDISEKVLDAITPEHRTLIEAFKRGKLNGDRLTDHLLEEVVGPIQADLDKDLDRHGRRARIALTLDAANRSLEFEVCVKTDVPVWPCVKVNLTDKREDRAERDDYLATLAGYPHMSEIDYVQKSLPSECRAPHVDEQARLPKKIDGQADQRPATSRRVHSAAAI